MAPRRAAWAVAALACLAAVGCDRPVEGGTLTAPSLNVPEPSVAVAPRLSWLEKLPPTPTTASEGALAWASIPQPGSELVVVGVYTVERGDDGVITLVDKLGARTRGVPPALVHAVLPGNLAVGDAALFYTWTTGAVVGRVTRARDGRVRLRFDWSGESKDILADHAEPLRQGIAPLSFVSFPKFGRRSMGLVLALDETQAWVRTSAGHVELHRRDVLAPVELAVTALKVGARVSAYDWVEGFRPGVVSKVSEPGLRYEVRFDRTAAPEPFYFAQLSPHAETR